MKLDKLESLSFESGSFDGSGFKSISIEDLPLGEALPFSLYAPTMDLVTHDVSLKRIFLKNELYDKPFHDCLKRKGVCLLYFRKEDGGAFANYSLDRIRRVVSSASAASKEKAELLYGHAEYLIKEAFSESPSEFIINHSSKMMKTAATQLSTDPIAASELISIFSKDYYTFTHSVQVSFLGMAFCTYLGWPKADVAAFGTGALFHDIGKIDVDDAILNKPSKLDSDEFEEIKKHPLTGYEQLNKSELFSADQLKIILHHHENMDGRGYPAGLAGEQIHRYARVVRIVDCFDALTTKRVYKDAIPPTEALRMMSNEMQGCFDPQYLKAFIQFFNSDPENSIIADGEKRISAEVGSYLQVQLGGSEERFKVKLVGMDTGSYLIVQLPNGAGDLLFGGNQATVRYVSSITGTIYGFKAVILGFIVHPVRILVLSYPHVVEKHELRKHKRTTCFVPARAKIRSEEINGVITDISLGGCKYVANGNGKDQFPSLKQEESICLFSLALADCRIRSLKGMVRSASCEGAKMHIGLQFHCLDHDTRNELRYFIDKLEGSS